MIAELAVAWTLHSPARMLMSRLIVAVIVSSSTRAGADCPTRVDDLPAAGFLASMTRTLLEPEAAAAAAASGESGTRSRASIGVAAGMRAAASDEPQTASDDAVVGTAGLAAEVAVHKRSGLAGCASANVLDVRAGSARLAATAHVPLLFTGLGLGLSVDRNVLRPLASRHELWRAPVSRIAVQVSLAFLDLELAENANRLRLSVAPFMVEQGAVSQNALSATLDRRTTRLEISMVRLAARDADGSGMIDLFRLDTDWTTSTTMAADSGVAGYMRFSPLMLRAEGNRWSWELDGGLLALTGPIDCDVQRCARGFYRAGVRRAGRVLSIEGRAAREAFNAADNLPALEDRLSATAVARLRGDRLLVTGTGFIAATEAWGDERVARRSGAHTTLSHALGHGFAGLLDGEVVHSTSTAPELASAARVLVSLAWQKERIR